jgi:hypothetical protein
MSNEETVFADGMKAFKPHDRAPEFVKAELVIDCQQFEDFMKANHVMGEIRITIKEGQKGPYYAALNTYYAALNTWRPEPQQYTQPQPDLPHSAPPPPAFPSGYSGGHAG